MIVQERGLFLSYCIFCAVGKGTRVVFGPKGYVPLGSAA